MAIYGIGRVFLCPALGAYRHGIGALLSLAHGVHHLNDLRAAQDSAALEHAAHQPVLFMAFSITGGALLAGQITAGHSTPDYLSRLIQVAYWIMGDGRLAASGTTMETRDRPWSHRQGQSV